LPILEQHRAPFAAWYSRAGRPQSCADPLCGISLGKRLEAPLRKLDAPMVAELKLNALVTVTDCQQAWGF
jgi:hypothetical protein